MLRGAALTCAALLAGCAAPPVTSSPVRPAASGTPHVLLVVEENRPYAAVIGSPEAPYINTLAQRGGLVGHLFAQSHPSLPNYLELLSGSTWGIRDDSPDHLFDGPTFVDQLSAAGISWRAYMEGMPAPCFGGAAAGAYAKKHDPFMYFSSITHDASRCAGVVPAAEMTHDLDAGSMPAFAWLTPDLCHDGHDCSTRVMDAALEQTLAPVLASPWFAADGVVVVVWDEGADAAGCCGGATGGHVPAIVVSNAGSTRRVSGAPLDDAGVLAGLERLYGLPALRDAACACSGELFAAAPAASTSSSNG